MTDIIARPENSSRECVPQAQDPMATYEPVMSEAAVDRTGPAALNSTLIPETTETQTLPAPPAHLCQIFKAEYELIGKLGRGGMGDVYLAKNLRLKRYVALKVPQSSEQQERIQRFQREAQSLAALDHPNICRIYTIDRIGETHYLEIEFIKGRSLDRELGENQMVQRRAAEIARTMAVALQYSHDEKKIIHRDLKPSNVILRKKDGQPVIMDLGLAKRLDGKDSLVTQDYHVLGTPAYMPPEQLRGKVEEGKWHLCDIYSLLSAHLDSIFFEF
jgi:serine/threonine protein kinase